MAPSVDLSETEGDKTDDPRQHRSVMLDSDDEELPKVNYGSLYRLIQISFSVAKP